MSEPETRIHYRGCNLCEALCGVAIETRGDEVVSIRGDESDPFSRGYICPKAVALQDIQTDPDRLRHPIRRTPAGDWERLSWDEAFAEAGRRLTAIRDEHGRDALGVYLGNPNVHSMGPLMYGPPLLRALKTRNTYSATSVDQLPHQLAASQMFGHQLLLPIPDVDRTSYFLVLGANPLASNGSMMTAPGIGRRLRSLGERGGRLVVVDPRRTRTAEMADRHLFIRPGTDALFLLALLHVLFDEGLAAPGALGDRVDGLETLRELAAGFSPKRVAPRTGIGEEELRTVAREFGAAPSAVCYGRLGVSTQEFGGLCQWLVNAINVVTGNLDRPGGAMFTRPAVDLLKALGPGRLGRWKSRVRGLPEFSGELPASVLAEEIDVEGPGQIRGLITIAGNPVLSTPNGTALEAALGKLDFMVSVDLYLNETTRHADLILPPTAPLERDHYDLIFHALAVRNTAKFSPAVFEPPADSRDDWQILSELHRRLDDGPLRGRITRALAAWLGPRRLLDLGLRLGPYPLTLAKLKRSVHGVDLGPLEPCLPGRLRTPDKRIRLAPELFVADVERLDERLQASLEEGANGHLLLVGRRDLQSNNSWMHNFPRLMGGRPRCTLLMHPDDARRLGLADGVEAEVLSRTGRVVAPLEVSDEMMPGVVSLPHGWGHHREGTRLATAESHAGASANDVTDDRLVDTLSGNAAVNGVPVQVRPAA